MHFLHLSLGRQGQLQPCGCKQRQRQTQRCLGEAATKPRFQNCASEGSESFGGEARVRSLWKLKKSFSSLAMASMRISTFCLVLSLIMGLALLRAAAFPMERFESVTTQQPHETTGSSVPGMAAPERPSENGNSEQQLNQQEEALALLALHEKYSPPNCKYHPLPKSLNSLDFLSENGERPFPLPWPEACAGQEGLSDFQRAVVCRRTFGQRRLWLERHIRARRTSRFFPRAFWSERR